MDHGQPGQSGRDGAAAAVASHQSDFTSQAVSNLLWALAKLVDRTTPAGSETPCQPGGDNAVAPGAEISNLLWALAKLVDNGLLQLDQGGLTSQAVTALLPQVVTPPGPFNPQEISNHAVGAGETGGQRTAPSGQGRPWPARR